MFGFCGNMKYDLIKRNQETGAPEQMREKYARQLAVQPGETVFICGSTRTGEEELLLPVYTRLREKIAAGLLWIIGPRHLERLPVVTALLDRAGLGYELFSQCTEGSGKGRQEDIILLDSMGKLAELYAVGDYVFCGGSLVNKGGHNIMEPIGWRKPVFFGPFMQDFQDAVDLVLAAGAGVQVDSPGDLADYLLSHPLDSPVYEQLGQAADRLARTQQGAVERQAKMVMQVLGGADG
ncbi:MAG: hypothetical protein D3909_08715 [Candidatus Electrothrix sp. ATG1]|nr:hypothetical protein [Candidatus Electrothrix sp. ATG1]